jgi:hypothetical protein
MLLYPYGKKEKEVEGHLFFDDYEMFFILFIVFF